MNLAEPLGLTALLLAVVALVFWMASDVSYYDRAARYKRRTAWAFFAVAALIALVAIWVNAL